MKFHHFELIFMAHLLVFVTSVDSLRGSRFRNNPPKNSAESNEKLCPKLPDANGDGYSDLNDLQRFFRKKQLSKIEINEIFTIIDKNQLGSIGRGDWEKFYFVFLKPFEKCAKKEKYLVSYSDLEQCFPENSHFQHMSNQKKMDPILVQKIGSIMSGKIIKGKFYLNFFQYVYLRRTLLAWEECTLDDSYIHRVEIFQCGMKIMVPNIFYNENHFNYIMSVADIWGGSGKFGFISFLNLFYKYYQFYQIVNWQLTNGVLTRRQLSAAIREGRLSPDKFSQNLVEKLFEGEESLKEIKLDFAAFFVLTTIQDNVYLFGEKKDGIINLKEFQAILEKKGFFRTLNDNINSINLDYNQDYIDKIEEKSKDHLEFDLPKEEKDFIIPYSFRRNSGTKRFFSLNSLSSFKSQKILQDNQNATLKDVDKKREVIFRIIDLKDKKNIDSVDLLKLVKFSLIFDHLDKRIKHLEHLIYKKDVIERHKSFEMPLPPTSQELIKINYLADICGDYPINFLQFLIILEYNQVFKKYINKESGTSREVTFKNLKQGFHKLNLALTRHSLFQVKSVVITHKRDKDSEGLYFIEDSDLVDFELAVRNSLQEYSEWLYQLQFSKEKKQEKAQKK